MHALDFLYFWRFLPRARTVFERYIREMPAEERRILLLSQYILLRQRGISELFLDGLVGKNFFKALAFHLDHAKNYFDTIQKLCNKSISSGIRVHRFHRSQYQQENGIIFP
ncbi:MAG: hypothetical protein HQK81_15500 [Desulfovibrionaceae bacterium]|nr:hypothetical protein [Desulfovibrionaceae bacterium]MBF0515447.1 hypothetical protein [Desulfovibrionaceae bacterium]